MTRAAFGQQYPGAPVGWPADSRDAWNHLIAALQRRDNLERSRSNDSGSGGGGPNLDGIVAIYRNRIINPAMQISQERGTALVDCTSLTTYTIDQWQAALTFAPLGQLRVQQIASFTPSGSPFRLRHTVILADPGTVAGRFYTIRQPIEGQAIADARFGGASARQLLLRLGVNTSLAGTYGVSIRNSATNRSWVGTFTVASGEVNTDLVRTLNIPGDTSGTWLINNGVGLFLTIALTVDTPLHGAVGWQTGNFLTTSAQVNFMGTVGATFELFDVGLYVDLLGSGAVPPFEVPDPAAELIACQRYYQRMPTSDATLFGAGSPAVMSSHSYLPTTMRATPVASVPVAPTLANCTTFVVTATTTGVLQQATMTGPAQQYSHAGGTIALSARF